MLFGDKWLIRVARLITRGRLMYNEYRWVSRRESKAKVSERGGLLMGTIRKRSGSNDLSINLPSVTATKCLGTAPAELLALLFD